MEKAINIINKIVNEKPFIKKIHVYGWQKEYDYILISSLTKYLFEDLNIIENIAPLTNENREGRKKQKYYITVHDTGDADPNHSAKFWSETVKNEQWEQGKYAASYQYVVGNDGIFHNIPDDEVAWHAGDSTRYDYKLYETNVKGNNNNPIITVSDDGYYEIDGKKSIVLAPRVYKERDNQIIEDRIATTKDINSQGILCKLVNGNYYIGETYFNSSFMLIANRGGNNNSIGIESCINEGTDIYYTWQKTAKLVANLLINNSLSFDDVKQHHYFSGKNCPQTIRMNGMWDHFMDLVKAEYEILELIKEGYQFKLIVDSNLIESNGRIIAIENNKTIYYTIQIIKDNKVKNLNYSIIMNN